MMKQEFQFHKVRLEAGIDHLHPPVTGKFQFHKVRLEANEQKNVGNHLLRFNSIRYD